MMPMPMLNINDSAAMPPLTQEPGHAGVSAVGYSVSYQRFLLLVSCSYICLAGHRPRRQKLRQYRGTDYVMYLSAIGKSKGRAFGKGASVFGANHETVSACFKRTVKA